MIKVVFILGPYRNLTTMLSTYINLHENVLVFNHGYHRIKKYGCDFWNKMTEESYNNFIKFVNENYLLGSRGQKGGNITYAHASDKKNVISKYNVPIKKNIKYILIKDSGRITNDLRINFKDFDKINELLSFFNGKIYFIRPIRNILKSVLSNQSTGTYKLYSELKIKNDMFKWYLEDLNWFYICKKTHPDIFCYFYEKDISKINSIFCDFLKLKLTDTLCNEFKITDNRVVNILPIYKLVLNNLLKNNNINKELFNELIQNDANISEINNLK
jgi:hypothetical protein